jgi:type II secretory pathway component PulK
MKPATTRDAHHGGTGNPGAGSVLILALWTLFFLAALAVAVGAHVSASLRLAGALKAETMGRYLARAGIQRAALEVLVNTNGWDGLAPRAWNNDASRFRDVPLGEGVYAVTYTYATSAGQVCTNFGLLGEESKVNVERSTKTLILSVFRVLGGTGTERAEELYQAILSYKEEKRQRMLTKLAGGKYSEPKIQVDGRLQTLQELLLVKGFDGDLFSRVAPFLTLFGNGQVNVNAASPEVIRCCVDAFPEKRAQVEAILSRRDGGAAVESGESIAAMGIGFLDVQSTCFGGTAWGKRPGSGAVGIDFVIDRNKGRLLYWHEH